MVKNEQKMPLPKLDDLFTTEQERQDAELEKVCDLQLDKLHDFPKHPFKVIINEEMQEMAQSVEEHGVLVPALVRPLPNGEYQVIAGHRRKKASELANKETMPCIIRDLTDDEAIIIMVDSNLQRENILPSERAFAYKMKLEAMKRQGARTDLTCDQVGNKLNGKKSVEILANEVGDSKSNIHRYIRLTELVKPLLNMVDNKIIAFNPAVELSYLSQAEQKDLLDIMDCNDCTPSLSQAIKLKKLSQEKTLTTDVMQEIMEQEKANQIPRLKISMDRLSPVLPRDLRTNEEREEYVIKAVEFFDRYQKRKKEKLAQEQR